MLLSTALLIAVIIERGLCSLICGDRLRDDIEQLGVPAEWYSCYITYLGDPAYQSTVCSELIVDVCGGYDATSLLAAGGNYGCWHGLIDINDPTDEASDATNNVIMYSCRNDIQHSTRLTAWGGENVLLGVCLRCPGGIPQATDPPTCPIAEADTFDWDELMADGTHKPDVTFTLDVDATDLSLDIDVDVPYIVKSTVTSEDIDDLPVTYVLDFEDFDAHKSSITQPNSCSNRLEEDYVGLNVDQRFQILSEDFHAIGTEENMCFPPPAIDDENIISTGWEINLDESDCNTIKYRGRWKWSDLRECRNNANALTAAGEEQTFIDTTDPNYLRLTGTIYLNLVSPFWNGDFNQYGNYYRVYQLISQPWVIQISKSVYVISSTDVNVMTMSIISVYKEDQDYDYALILLTETAEYMQLANPTLVAPSNTAQYTLNIENAAETGAECLNNKAFLCGQLWRVYAVDTVCTTDRDETTGVGGINFSGDYTVKFEPQCRTGAGINGYDFNTHCTTWLGNHPDFNANAAGVVLTSALTFVDNICESRIFTVDLTAQMQFYEDTEPPFTTAIITENGNTDYLYQVGESTVYSEITMDFPVGTDIFGSTLVNVWICTFPPDATYDDPGQTAPNNPTGGCFGDQVDGFNDPNNHFFFHIYSSQQNPALETEGFFTVENGDVLPNRIRFGFIVPHAIQRDQLYVHAQIEVLLAENNLPRRLLLNAKTANRFEQFGKEIGITDKDIHNQPEPQIPQQPQQPHNYAPQPQTPPQQPFTISLNSTWIIAIGGLLAVILTCNIIFMCYMNCCKTGNGRPRVSFNKNRRSGYDSVKHVDSEEFDDSEANLIHENE